MANRQNAFFPVPALMAQGTPALAWASSHEAGMPEMEAPGLKGRLYAFAVGVARDEGIKPDNRL